MRRAIVAAVVLASIALVGWSRGGGTHNATPDYVTIAVFGDLQRMMDDYRTGGPTEEGYAELDAAVDWIVANRDREKIDLVLAVGDLINSGIGLPPYGSELAECDDEQGAPWRVDYDVVCPGVDCPTGLNEATCKATAGLFWAGNPAEGAGSCASCQQVERAQTEWEGFELIWDQFEAASIPALLVRGNHDNVGTHNAIDTDREPLGWNDRYPTSAWQASNLAQLVDSYDDNTTGDGHAWIVTVGGRRMILVTIACCTIDGVEDAAENWALGVMDDYSTLPAMVLTHHANSIETLIVDESETDAPNLFAYFGGHDSDRLKSIRTIGAKEVLRIETDWTNADGTPADDHDENRIVQNDYFALVRLYLNTDEVEAFDFSPEGLSKNVTSANRILKQAFSID